MKTISRRTLAQRLDQLFESRGPYSYAEVERLSREIATATGGPTVSHQTVQNIRTGAVTNPGLNSLIALAAVFGVSPTYFLDDSAPDGAERSSERHCPAPCCVRNRHEQASGTEEPSGPADAPGVERLHADIQR